MRKLVNKPRGVFEGKNFMTPDIVGYYKIAPRTYVELSKGEGFSHNAIYGVTVKPDPEHNLSICLPSMEAAIAYIETLADVES